MSDCDKLFRIFIVEVRKETSLLQCKNSELLPLKCNKKELHPLKCNKQDLHPPYSVTRTVSPNVCQKWVIVTNVRSPPGSRCRRELMPWWNYGGRRWWKESCPQPTSRTTGGLPCQGYIRRSRTGLVQVSRFNYNLSLIATTYYFRLYRYYYIYIYIYYYRLYTRF